MQYILIGKVKYILNLKIQDNLLEIQYINFENSNLKV